jgi:glutamate N-acetyltransferase/amino-acid N-acetyltransferase
MTGLKSETDAVASIAGKLVRSQGVTSPAGFRAAGIPAGIKASGRSDLALVFNEGPDFTPAGPTLVPVHPVSRTRIGRPRRSRPC